MAEYTHRIDPPPARIDPPPLPGGVSRGVDGKVLWPPTRLYRHKSTFFEGFTLLPKGTFIPPLHAIFRWPCPLLFLLFFFIVIPPIIPAIIMKPYTTHCRQQRVYFTAITHFGYNFICGLSVPALISDDIPPLPPYKDL